MSCCSSDAAAATKSGRAARWRRSSRSMRCARCLTRVSWRNWRVGYAQVPRSSPKCWQQASPPRPRRRRGRRPACGRVSCLRRVRCLPRLRRRLPRLPRGLRRRRAVCGGGASAAAARRVGLRSGSSPFSGARARPTRLRFPKSIALTTVSSGSCCDGSRLQCFLRGSNVRLGFSSAASLSSSPAAAASAAALAAASAAASAAEVCPCATLRLPAADALSLRCLPAIGARSPP